MHAAELIYNIDSTQADAVEPRDTIVELDGFDPEAEFESYDFDRRDALQEDGDWLLVFRTTRNEDRTITLDTVSVKRAELVVLTVPANHLFGLADFN